ncbi:MAG: hypothetical protein WAU86_21575 [Oricola sp.]
MRTRTMIAALIYLPLNAVLFGVGAIAVLSIPFPPDWVKYLLPIVVVAALALTAPVAWYLAPKLRLRGGRHSAPLR